MRVIKDNIELIIKDEDFDKYQKKGFKSLDGANRKDNNVVDLNKLKAEELRDIAKAKEVPNYESLNRNELLKVLSKL